MLFAFFIMLIFVVTMDVELLAPTAVVLDVAVAVPLRRLCFGKFTLWMNHGMFAV